MSALRRYDPLTMRPVLNPPDGRDDPRTAVPLPGYSLRGHAVVGRSGVPRVDPATRAEANRRWKAKREAQPGRWPQARCGASLRPGGRASGEPCARLAGHSGGHRSAEAMDYNRRVRRGETL